MIVYLSVACEVAMREGLPDPLPSEPLWDKLREAAKLAVENAVSAAEVGGRLITSPIFVHVTGIEPTYDVVDREPELIAALNRIIERADAFDANHDRDSANFTACEARIFEFCRMIAREAIMKVKATA